MKVSPAPRKAGLGHSGFGELEIGIPPYAEILLSGRFVAENKAVWAAVVSNESLRFVVLPVKSS